MNRTQKPLMGSMTAMITPFRDGRVDERCLADLIERQIAGGTDWLVPCGTTGESPTLSHEEHDRVIALTIEKAAGRVPVMAGAGSNCTEEAVRLSRQAEKEGAQAILSVVPYYNRPSQEGLYRHFAAVADAVEIPVVLYNVPFRTGMSLANETIARLRKGHPNVAALKHATGAVAGIDELADLCDIIVLSGDDSLTWPLMALGAKGVISVIANLVPRWMKDLTQLSLASDGAAALRQHRQVTRLADGIAPFGPNPIPIKSSMALRGLTREEFRLPLCSIPGEAKERLKGLLDRLGA